MPRYGLVIDLDRCLACQACVIACKIENNVPDSTPETFRSKKMTLRTRVVPLSVARGGQYPNVVDIYPVLCNQCDNPPCVAACPTGASYKRADGIVLIDWGKCIGCRYCMAACPYSMRNFIEADDPKAYHNPDIAGYYKSLMPPKGKVDKCTFCAHLVDKGEEPACVAECPARARTFGDLNNPTSAISRLLASRESFVLRPQFGTKPMVYYLR